MLSISHRTLVRVLCILSILSMVLLPGFTGKNSSLTVTGSITSAQTGRSYDQFITGAYQGVGRLPTCLERQEAYDALAYAASTGNLHAEARRFVSTLFIIQQAYDDPSLSHYNQTGSCPLFEPEDCQISLYEERNPAYFNPFINMRSAEFITDLYHTFLLREPEPAGFNSWMSVIPTSGRKAVLNGFRDSIEFSNLVSALYPGVRPTCGCGFIRCPPGYIRDPVTCECMPSECGPYRFCPEYYAY
jgi:Domain of unknown function (DUF4214)